MQRTAGGLEATHCGPIALIGILVRSAEAGEHVIGERLWPRAYVCVCVRVGVRVCVCVAEASQASSINSDLTTSHK